MLIVPVVYFTDLDDLNCSWERDWLKELFRSTSLIQFCFQRFKLPSTTSLALPDHQLDSQRSVDNQPDSTVQPTNLIPILILNRSCLSYLPYFQDQPYLVVHLSDEYLTDPVDFYNDANCLHVFRNYLKPGYLHHPKVTYFPLGYKQGMFTPDQVQLPVPGPSVKHRPYLWSFVGCPNKSGRSAILASLSSYQPNFQHLTGYWNAPGSLTSVEMRDVLYQSQIVPCLKGNVNIDTFRLFEALECGCIPIVERHNPPFFDHQVDYFQVMFPDHLIPVADNHDFQTVIAQLSQLTPAELEAKRLAIWNWYQNYKQTLKNHIHQTIETLVKPKLLVS